MSILNKKDERDSEDQYIDLFGSDEIVDNQGIPTIAAGKLLIVTRYEGIVYAISRLCPHAAGLLDEGSISRGRIDCPDHEYRFDIRTGRILWPEDEFCQLKRYEVKEEDGRIKVKVS